MMKEKTPKYFTAYDRLKDVKTLIKEYTDSLGIDLSFQSFEKEMSDLKGKYGFFRGSMHLCYVDDEAVGIIALTDFDGKRGEMKRLYVKPQYRGKGIARKLSEIIIEDAKKIGYEGLLLDSLSDMKTAQALYYSLGFEEIPPYYENPIPGTVYMYKKLK